MSALPTLSLPSYEVNLPSKPELIYRFRPFVLREEKLLLMSSYSDDKMEFSKAIKKILVDCSLNPTFDEAFVNSLSYFDTEYLYLALRARSVGEIQEVEYTCNHDVALDGNICGHKVKVKVDFTKMEVDIPEGHERSIKLSDNIVLNMNYPSYEYLEVYSKKIAVEDQSAAVMFDFSLEYLAGLINNVITDDGVISAKDFSKEEAIEWLGNLTEDNFMRIQKTYLDKSPKVIMKTHFLCGKCGWEQDLVLEGLESFFD